MMKTEEINLSLAKRRAEGLLEDLKKSRGYIYDSLFWLSKLESSHLDHSYFDHAVSVSALTLVEQQIALLRQCETHLKLLQSKGISNA